MKWPLNVLQKYLNCTMVQAFTCAANASTAVHNHRGAPWRPRPTRAQAPDCSLPLLKYMLTKVQHCRSTFGYSEVWPADIEVVAHLPSLSRLIIGHKGSEKKTERYQILSFEMARTSMWANMPSMIIELHEIVIP